MYCFLKLLPLALFFISHAHASNGKSVNDRLFEEWGSLFRQEMNTHIDYWVKGSDSTYGLIRNTDNFISSRISNLYITNRTSNFKTVVSIEKIRDEFARYLSNGKAELQYTRFSNIFVNYNCFKNWETEICARVTNQLLGFYIVAREGKRFIGKRSEEIKELRKAISGLLRTILGERMNIISGVIDFAETKSGHSLGVVQFFLKEAQKEIKKPNLSLQVINNFMIGINIVKHFKLANEEVNVPYANKFATELLQDVPFLIEHISNNELQNNNKIIGPNWLYGNLAVLKEQFSSSKLIENENKIKRYMGKMRLKYTEIDGIGGSIFSFISMFTCLWGTSLMPGLYIGFLLIFLSFLLAWRSQKLKREPTNAISLFEQSVRLLTFRSYFHQDVKLWSTTLEVFMIIYIPSYFGLFVSFLLKYN